MAKEQDYFDDDIREILNKTKPSIIRMTIPRLVNKKSEDNMSSVTFELYTKEDEIALPGNAKIIIGNNEFDVILVPTRKTNIYLTSPIPCLIKKDIAIYTIDGLIKFSIGDREYEEFFSGTIINDLYLKKP